MTETVIDATFVERRLDEAAPVLPPEVWALLVKITTHQTAVGELVDRLEQHVRSYRLTLDETAAIASTLSAARAGWAAHLLRVASRATEWEWAAAVAGPELVARLHPHSPEPIPDEPGQLAVYWLIDSTSEVVYVGLSKHVTQRLTDHVHERGELWSSWAWIDTGRLTGNGSPRDRQRDAEAFLIDRLDPELNRQPEPELHVLTPSSLDQLIAAIESTTRVRFVKGPSS